MHLVNLFLAGIWLALGVCLIAYERLAPGGGVPHIPFTDWSLGWLALALSGYNILRWWRRWKSGKAESQRKESKRQAELARRDREFRESGRERDPNFIFDESAES